MSQSLVQCSQEYRSKLIITSTLNLWPTKRLYIHNSNLIQQKLFRGRQMLLQGGNFFYTCEIGKDGDHSGRCTYVGCSIMHRNMEASQFEEPVNTKCSYYFITCKNPKPCTLSNFARITSMLFTPTKITESVYLPNDSWCNNNPQPVPSRPAKRKIDCQSIETLDTS